ncbi:MAG: tetratricopeptide repeat protein [Candidatus Omnitrophica bacterium]|nr:tetratricopeptide repeat protein [Candidatus Omnitrophota bacterium]
MLGKEKKAIYPKRYYRAIISVIALFFFSVSCLAQSLSQQARQIQAQTYYQEGKRLVHSGNIEEALGYFQKALLFDPTFIPLYNEIGIIYTLKGWPERAKEMYLQAITLDPNYAPAYANLALLYEEEENIPQALQCWKIRASLGQADDVWTKVARQRVQELAEAYPGVYEKVLAGQYPLEKPGGLSWQPSQTSPEENYSSEVKFVRPEKVTLFADEKNSSSSLSSPSSVIDYIARAKAYYEQGKYVEALREATIAEYFDPTNREIVVLIQQIREAILE